MFDWLFGPTEQKSTAVVDPYANMPTWQANYYKGDVSRTNDLLRGAGAVADDLAYNPQQLQGLSQQELDANAAIQAQMGISMGGIDTGLGAVNSQYGTSNRQMKQASAGVGQSADIAAGFLDDAADYGDDWGAYEQMLMGSADYDAFRTGYENPYTQNVVDTTLRSMQHQADVEQAQRAASEAAVGGISSTRMAVADATAEALNGMNMAQMEAALRSEGFNTASNLGLQQQQMQMGIANSGFGEQEAESRLNMDLAGANFGLQEDYSRLMADLAAAGYDLSSAYLDDQTKAALEQMGLTQTGATWDATTGEQQRLINDANAEAQRTAAQDALTWESQIFNSSRGIQAPVGTTQTSTTPGPSPFNQAVGAATSAAGVWAGIPV